MPIEIPAEHEQFVKAIISRGIYNSEDEVVDEALRLLKKRESRIEQLREELAPALARLERGEGIELDEETLLPFLEEIKAEGKRRLAERHNNQK